MKINVNISKDSYPVIIECNAVKNHLPKFIKQNQKILIISDDGIPFKYINEIKEQLSSVHTFIFNQGEQSKNIDTYQQIISYLINNHFSKSDVIIALGGGVVSDLSSFVASTYKRGMNLILIPTTTLAMVDASIGEKNGIDYENIKNAIGTFYSPLCVLIDHTYLKSLSLRHYRNGLIEALKSGLIGDKQLYDLFRNVSSINDNIEEIIFRSLCVKVKLVEKDEYDLKERHVLNFGHTFGHALESYSNFKLLHGEAVALGMLIVSKGEKYYDSLIEILNELNINTDITFNKEDILDIIKNDKKCYSNNIDIVRVHNIGEAFIESITFDKLIDFLR